MAKTVCLECGSDDIHEFSVRSDYGSFHAVNGGKPLDKPYYVNGHYCGSCDSAVSIEEKMAADEKIPTDEEFIAIGIEELEADDDFKRV